MTGRVEGKVAIITGAAGGLGSAIARMLATEGAEIVATDIDLDRAEVVADEIGGAAIALPQDVTDEARWKEVLAETVNRFGGLHILVNNAGIGTPGTVEETSLEDWRKVHAIDLDSVFLGSKHAIPHMRASTSAENGGSIVNISSIAGIIAGHNMAAYNSAKAGVRHLSKSVALHCARAAPHVRCNSVHPTFIDTPILDQIGSCISRDDLLEKLARQVPLRRVGTPKDVAHGVLYLASDESSFVTGAELVIDGGISAQ